MDCSFALEVLDCVRPNSDDLSLPELAEARTHLESCFACQSEFARRQQLDQRIATAMHAVAVPSDLESRLQASLQSSIAADVALNSATNQRSVDGRRSRRRWLSVSVAAVLAIAAISLWPNSGSSFSVDHILNVVQTDVSAANAFDGSFETRLPTDWNHPGLRWMTDWRGQDLDEQPGHEVALRVFRFTSRKGQVIDGLLATLPGNRVTPQPTDSSFMTAAPHYPSRAGHKFVAVAWRDQSSVFFCLVPDTVADLELLQRAMRGLSA